MKSFKIYNDLKISKEEKANSVSHGWKGLKTSLILLFVAPVLIIAFFLLILFIISL